MPEKTDIHLRMKKLAYPLIEWNPTFKACAAFEIFVLVVRTDLLVTMTIKRYFALLFRRLCVGLNLR